MLDEVIKYINLLPLCDNDSIVIAVSGGPDSMCLLDLLIKYRLKKRINIVCAHVNHSKREQSEIEKEYVKSYCKDNDIMFEYFKINEYSNGNFHDQARNIRYNFFDSLIQKYNSKYLFMAHHGDDLVETILMRIARGSSIKGYCGFRMKQNRENYNIIRPLIFITKNDILKYNEKNNIKYYIDESNDKDVYTRNRYRKYILPFLKSENKNIHKKYLEFSNELYKQEEYISKIVNRKYIEYVINDILDITKIIKEDKIIQERIIYLMLEDIYEKNITMINSKHIKSIFDMINSNKPNSFVNLPNKIDAIKEYNKFYIGKDCAKSNGFKFLLINSIDYYQHSISIVDRSNDTSNYTIRLDSNEIVLPLYVRNRINGDYIEVKGLNGRKKIKDILIDSKIPAKNRDNIPLLVDSSGKVLCIFGIKKSKYDKQTNEFYDIIVKCIKKEETI